MSASDVERLIVGDARDTKLLLRRLIDDESRLAVTITSPPYWKLKNYGAQGQIGWRQSYPAYLDDCESIFKQILDRTSAEGSLWVISDTLVNQNSSPRGLVQLPTDLAARAERAGWTLRDVYIWRKDKTLPYSGRGRLRNAFEYIHFFVKSESYVFRVDRLRDPVNLTPWWVQYPERYNPMGKVPTNVWDIPIPQQGTWGAGTVQHACPLPPDLVERIVLLASEPGDIIFDPFAGTGTVLAEAARLGRLGRGIELNPAYVETYRRQIRETVLTRSFDDEFARHAKQTAKLNDAVRKLRALKYPKVISQAYRRLHNVDLPVRFACALVEDGSLATNIKATVYFVADGTKQERSELQVAIRGLQDVRPMSRFQVDASVHVVNLRSFKALIGGSLLSVYEHGRTWHTERTVRADELPELSRSSKRGNYIPIISNIAMKETAHRDYA